MLIMKEETLWKNNLNFIKDVPMMYVNFIIGVMIVLRKTWEALLSYHPLYLQYWFCVCVWVCVCVCVCVCARACTRTNTCIHMYVDVLFNDTLIY